MREPHRVNELLQVINQIWAKHPDLRFNQLIYLLQFDYADTLSGACNVEVSNEKTVDLFYVEDEDFLKYLKEQSKSFNFIPNSKF